MTTPVFYDPRQNVAGLASFSPSAGKPARFVELLQHYDYRGYGPHAIGPVIPVTREDLYRVHSRDYVIEVFDGTTLNGFENRDPRVPVSCLWTIGSLLSASRSALARPDQPMCSPTSGFHHAGYAWGGGYCTFNGLMVVAAKLISEQPGFKVAILDCDFHYGDGTADILKKFPALAPYVAHHTAGKHFHGDDPDSEAMEFTLWLKEVITDINDFKPDLVLYQAGADPHLDDPLGGFMRDADLALRDRSVFCGIQAPIAWNLAGGYQKGVSHSIFDDPVLRIHRTTMDESNASARVRLV